MFVILSFIGILLSLLLVIGIHEAGHAIAARRLGVKILKISIGFGRPLLTWQSPRGWQWIWAIWPLGGFVELLNTRIKPVEPSELPLAFDKKPIWARCVILFSGSLANLILAYFALMLVFMIGYRQAVPVVAAVEKNSIAAQAGIQVGDQIISVAGENIHSWSDAYMTLFTALGKGSTPIILKKQDGVTYKTSFDLNKGRSWHKKYSLLGFIGITPNTSSHYLKKIPGVNLIQASQAACIYIKTLSCFFIVILKQLFTGMIPFATLLGPMSVFKIMTQAFLEGLVVFSYFIANLSMVFALVNLLPIPTLDGGSILYAVIEKIRGQPISVALEVLIHRITVIVFSVLLIQLLLNDVKRFVLGH